MSFGLLNLVLTDLIIASPLSNDGTFLTGKYHGTLLTTITQDGNRKIFPLAFVIVEGETKEAMIWFF